MDLSDIQQNLNTRVVFREPRGMVRWLQLLFAILAIATVLNFSTTIGISITCPTSTPQTTSTSPPPTTSTTTTVTTTTTTTPAPSNSPSIAQPAAASTSSSTTTTTTTPNPTSSQATVIQATPPTQISPKLVVAYPFDFTQMEPIINNCQGGGYTYLHNASLDASPFFFTMTGILSLVYASTSLAIYLFFSANYQSMPVLPVADLIVSGILCLFWLIASLSFSAGSTLLKTTANYPNLKQVLCPIPFESLAGVTCTDLHDTNWKPLDVGLISGYTSILLWGVGMWFVYKETHFHTSADQFDGTR